MCWTWKYLVPRCKFDPAAAPPPLTLPRSHLLPPLVSHEQQSIDHLPLLLLLSSTSHLQMHPEETGRTRGYAKRSASAASATPGEDDQGKLSSSPPSSLPAPPREHPADPQNMAADQRANPIHSHHPSDPSSHPFHRNSPNPRAKQLSPTLAQNRKMALQRAMRKRARRRTQGTTPKTFRLDQSTA